MADTLGTTAEQGGDLLTQVITGDATIADILARPGVVVIPARSCNIDGFTDDVLTEYANPSIFRPPSVRRARLQSVISGQGRLYHQHGQYYIGLTMYDTAGEEEEFAVWLGEQRIGTIRADRNDNRLHLYVLPQRFEFRGNDLVRFITATTNGTYRVENFVLLPSLPKGTPATLTIRDAYLSVRHESDGTRSAIVTWLTNRPATGEMMLFVDDTATQQAVNTTSLVNHELVTGGLPAHGELRAQIISRSVAGTGIPEGTQVEVEVRAQNASPRPVAVAEAAKRLPLALVAAADTPTALEGRVRSWPVTCGIPFAPGTLSDLENLRLLQRTADGKEMETPCQARTQAKWPDGSVRWALLDFQANLNRNLSADAPWATYEIEYGLAVRRRPATAEEGPLRVEDTPAAVRVMTGPLLVEVPRDTLVVPGRLFLRDETTGKYDPVIVSDDDAVVILEDLDGTRYQGEVDTVGVEEAGPERAVVRVEARHLAPDGRQLFRSVFRVYAYRGQPFVRLLHTFENDNIAETFTTIRSLTLRTGHALSQPQVAEFMGERVPLADSSTRLSVLQELDSNYLYKTNNSDAPVAHEGRCSGSIAVEDETGLGVAIRLRNFWQNYPKGLAAEPGALEIGICPPLRPETFRPGHPDEDRLYYYLVGGVYRLKHGVARTHEMLFACYRGKDGRAATQALVGLFESPPVVRMPPEVYIQSQAINEVAAKDSQRFPSYEGWVEDALESVLAEREYWRDYGMLNFGDWYGERRYNWGNMEYDTPLGFLTEYLRGGDTRFFRLAEQAARHLSDVDTCHYAADSSIIWGQYHHCIGHVGDYYPRAYRTPAMGFPRIEHDHTWVEGLFLFSLLTGDQRIWESAIGTARRIGGAGVNDFDYLNGRDAGWPLIHLMAGYHATGGRFFLNGAKVIVERALERQRPSGGWERLMLPGHCFCEPPRHMGEAGFMVSILLEGLKRYHQATGDARVAQSIVRGAANIIRDTWSPKPSAFRYTSCPYSELVETITYTEGLCYAYRLSGDEGLRAIIEAALRAALKNAPPKFSIEQRMRIPGDTASAPLEQDPGVGKPISTWLRWAPRTLYDLAGITEEPL